MLNSKALSKYLKIINKRIENEWDYFQNNKKNE